MPLEQLWAPWRLPYILSTKDHKPAGCFLCASATEPERDAENLVVARDESVYAVLNRFPYNNGHVLVAPYSHKANLVDLNESELLGSMLLLQRITAVMDRTFHPDGYNLGVNLGQVAGAGLPGHLHWHLVPRWRGDTNFMTVLADVNVIPQSLAAAQELLARELAAP